MIIGCPRCHLRYDISHRDPRTPVDCRCGAQFMVPNLSNLARAWNCPSCAGATDPAKNQCDFCGVFLAFARCPDCLSLAFEGAKFCHQCGGNLNHAAQPLIDSPTELPCPRCKSSLHTRETAGVQIDHCLECGGLWLEHAVLQQLLDHRGQKKAAESYLRKLKPQAAFKLDQKVVYLKCPDCSKLMHRRNFGQSSGIIVDECAAHGIWFDADELAGVIDFARRTQNGVTAHQSQPTIPNSNTQASATLERMKQQRREERGLWSEIADVFESLISR